MSFVAQDLVVVRSCAACCDHAVIARCHAMRSTHACLGHPRVRVSKRMLFLKTVTSRFGLLYMATGARCMRACDVCLPHRTHHACASWPHMTPHMHAHHGASLAHERSLRYSRLLTSAHGSHSSVGNKSLQLPSIITAVMPCMHEEHHHSIGAHRVHTHARNFVHARSLRACTSPVGAHRRSHRTHTHTRPQFCAYPLARVILLVHGNKYSGVISE